ncbi:MAG: ATP synthase F1 subunit epsilon [Planctomycetaceae bacterium]|nr:ATP synthase F1 subunit epsilon [Planctomycetaceae bacterium]
MADLRLVLVTPEKTLFDKPVASIKVPMFDGSAGIYPGRAPLVGRLGVGELTLKGGDGASDSYFIEGGFIQIKGEQVSVLTNAATPAEKISRTAAAEELAAAKAEKATTDDAMEAVANKIDRARKLVKMATAE